MRRETALRYAREIARRVHSVNGLLATPGCSYEAIRIKRMWIFGSTVKGKPDPNDLDLLIEMSGVGRRRIASKRRHKKGFTDHTGHRPLLDGMLDKRQLRNYGVTTVKDSREYAFMWITKNLRHVSRHTTDLEGVETFIEQVLIYPRWDLHA